MASAEREQVTLLLDSGEIRTFDLDAVSGIRLADPALQAQFKDYLTAVAQSRSNENLSPSVGVSSIEAGATMIERWA